MIGLRATIPLDLGTLKRAREGHAAEAQGADWTYQRKAFEEERDWADLTAKFTQAKERLKLAVDLEKVQHEKLTYERDRQQRGRSTLQQVLIYETDFEQAQLGRIRTLADLLQLGAQMKLYGVSYESR
jgi:outer membrane protein TolC